MADQFLKSADSDQAFGWLKDAAGWVLPGFMVTGVSAVFADKYGDEVPSFLKPATDALASLYNGVIDFIRNTDMYKSAHRTLFGEEPAKVAEGGEAPPAESKSGEIPEKAAKQAANAGLKGVSEAPEGGAPTTGGKPKTAKGKEA